MVIDQRIILIVIHQIDTPPSHLLVCTHVNQTKMLTYFLNKWTIGRDFLLPGMGSPEHYPVTGVRNDDDYKSIAANIMLYEIANNAGILECITKWMEVLLCGGLPTQIPFPSNHQIGINYYACQTKLLSECSRFVGMVFFMTRLKISHKAIQTFCQKKNDDDLMPMYAELNRLASFKWDKKMRRYKAVKCPCELETDWSWMSRPFMSQITPHDVFDSKVGNNRGATVRANKITYSKRQTNKVGRLVRSKE
jgi:hypothetical protein